MKIQTLLLLALAIVGLGGCATSTPSGTAQVGDFTILSAEFGHGNHVADVTPRVIQLLQTQPNGFLADAPTLGADPLPGKKKVLTIRYEFKGHTYLFTLPGAKRLTYEALEKNTDKGK